MDKDDYGKLVAYYDEGWRYGYLEQIVKDNAKIRPIVIYGSPRLVTVPIEDVRIQE